VRGIRGGSSEEGIIKHAHTSAARTTGTATPLFRVTVRGIRGGSSEEGIINHTNTSTAVAATTTTHRG
jgi:hypothetical protein